MLKINIQKHYKKSKKSDIVNERYKTFADTVKHIIMLCINDMKNLTEECDYIRVGIKTIKSIKKLTKIYEDIMEEIGRIFKSGKPILGSYSEFKIDNMHISSFLTSSYIDTNEHTQIEIRLKELGLNFEPGWFKNPIECEIIGKQLIEYEYEDYIINYYTK